MIHQNFRDEVAKHLPQDQVDQFFEACRIPLKKSITINTAKISVKDFITITKKWWWTLTPTDFVKDSKTFYIDRENTDVALWNTFLHAAWYFYIQEVAAASSAPQVNLSAWDIVLDMAAAPWGKTSQLATSLIGMEKPGMVIANDVASSRLRQLAHNLNRWGAYNTAITKFNWFSFGKNLPNFFDHILLDAPCSWEGTAFKSEFALKHRKIEEINKIAWTQFQLLVSAIKATKPWGTVVYSTCTINPYENEYILEKALDFFKDDIEIERIESVNTHRGLQLDDLSYDPQLCARLRPHVEKTWWFFISKIRKKNASTIPYQQPHKLSPKNQFKLTKSKQLQSEAGKFLKENFWISLDQDKHLLVATKDVVYLTSPQFDAIQKHLHCEKVWIPVLKKDRLLWFRPTHYLGNILWHTATKQTVDISPDLAQEYSRWANLVADSLWISTEKIAESRREQDKNYLLTRDGRWFSRTKWVKGEWKNKFGK